MIFESCCEAASGNGASDAPVQLVHALQGLVLYTWRAAASGQASQQASWLREQEEREPGGYSLDVASKAVNNLYIDIFSIEGREAAGLLFYAAHVKHCHDVDRIKRPFGRRPPHAGTSTPESLSRARLEGHCDIIPFTNLPLPTHVFSFLSSHFLP